jgi:hypothetical protein
MGYDSEKGFTSMGVDPSWQALLDQLGMRGIRLVFFLASLPSLSDAWGG